MSGRTGPRDPRPLVEFANGVVTESSGCSGRYRTEGHKIDIRFLATAACSAAIRRAQDSLGPPYVPWGKETNVEKVTGLLTGKARPQTRDFIVARDYTLLPMSPPRSFRFTAYGTLILSTDDAGWIMLVPARQSELKPAQLDATSHAQAP